MGDETLTFNEYQQKARTTAIYPPEGAIPYLALGLASEAGEVAGKVKKVLRDNGGYISNDNAGNILKEAADCLWYIAMLADELGVDMGHIASDNLVKLASRRERGTLGGSGDER
jgi:NTP pyrophosphatase (non-canonical NTP hydrolase)